MRTAIERSFSSDTATVPPPMMCPFTATTVSVLGGKGGEVVTTDGPFAETKEVLGGYYLLDCADLDQAIAWAARIPGAWHGKVEVRPIVVFE